MMDLEKIMKIFRFSMVLGNSAFNDTDIETHFGSHMSAEYIGDSSQDAIQKQQ